MAGKELIKINYFSIKNCFEKQSILFMKIIAFLSANFHSIFVPVLVLEC